MKTAIKSMKLDLHGVFSQRSYTIMMLCLFPVYAWLKMYFGIFLLPVLLMTFTFYFEEKGFHYHVAAPIKKSDKVTGRFMLLALMDLICLAVAVAGFIIFERGDWSGLWSEISSSIAVFSILAAVLLPFYFRYGHNGTTLIIVLALCAAFMGIALAIRGGTTIEEINSFAFCLQWIRPWLIPAAVAAVALSYLASLRIYLKKDL